MEGYRMNEHINPVVEIKRLNTDMENIDKAIKILIEKDQQDEVEMKRLRFDLDEFKASVKENKSDKTLSNSIKRFEKEFNDFKGETINQYNGLLEEVQMLEQFMNEERFKPVFDRLKELEQEFKKKALEIVQGSLANG